MKVDVLVSKYKELKSEEEKQAFILKHIKNNYINYEQKITEVTNIVNIGNHTEIVDPSDSTRTLNIFKRNTPIMYYLLKLTLIRNYSDIELDNNADEGQTLRSYNLLESMGFIDAFIAVLPETEVQKYHTILEMMNNDIYTNERDIASFLETKIDSLTAVVGAILSAFSEVANNAQDDQIEDNENK